uniref:Uncharacterized protein n=1 Tax=Anguilla anguilla TaxID=7936 RepID=A0A0E9RY87_ANGAN
MMMDVQHSQLPRSIWVWGWNRRMISSFQAETFTRELSERIERPPELSEAEVTPLGGYRFTFKPIIER